jgi:SOS-response transcriptional repressor LexA
MKQAVIMAEVPLYGEVGAGRVVPFVPREETVTVIVPRGVADRDHIGTLVVRGPSLSNEGIFDGDILVFRTNIQSSEITHQTICIVRFDTGELQAKKVVYDGRGHTICLRSSGGGIEDVFYPVDQIEILGIVIGMHRLL